MRLSGALTTLDEADAFRWLKWPVGVTSSRRRYTKPKGLLSCCWSRSATGRSDAGIRCSVDAPYAGRLVPICK